MKLLCWIFGHQWQEYVQVFNHHGSQTAMGWYRYCPRCERWEKREFHGGIVIYVRHHNPGGNLVPREDWDLEEKYGNPR